MAVSLNIIPQEEEGDICGMYVCDNDLITIILFSFAVVINSLLNTLVRNVISDIVLLLVTKLRYVQ